MYQQNSTSQDQQLLGFLQILHLSRQVGALPLRRRVLARDALHLLIGQVADEGGREDLDRRVGPADQMPVGGLHADVVHEAFARDLVVRLQDVVQGLDGMLNVAHVGGVGAHIG